MPLPFITSRISPAPCGRGSLNMHQMRGTGKSTFFPARSVLRAGTATSSLTGGTAVVTVCSTVRFWTRSSFSTAAGLAHNYAHFLARWHGSFTRESKLRQSLSELPLAQKVLHAVTFPSGTNIGLQLQSWCAQELFPLTGELVSSYSYSRPSAGNQHGITVTIVPSLWNILCNTSCANGGERSATSARQTSLLVFMCL